MTAEKFFHVFYPLKANVLCTVKSARILCALIITFWAMCDCQWFFFGGTHDAGAYKYCSFNFKRASQSYFNFYAILDSFLYAFIPSALLLILNTSIVTH